MTTAAEQQALLAVISSHDDALWWITHHQQHLTALLGKQMHAWLSLKEQYQAGEEERKKGKEPTDDLFF
jgi:hypothetical protein